MQCSVQHCTRQTVAETFEMSKVTVHFLLHCMWLAQALEYLMKVLKRLSAVAEIMHTVCRSRS